MQSKTYRDGYSSSGNERQTCKTSRIVNDTNVWLSALYFLGKPAQIVYLIEEKNLISITSNAILDELKEK